MTERGVPYHVAAYAMGKMLNHGSWQKGENRLRDAITPSDVDLIFDNAGKILFCEISRHFNNWADLQFGQRFMYESLIRGSKNCAVLCKHSVDWDSNILIDTRHDVECFQPMIYRSGEILCCELFRGNERWQRFIFGWFENSLGVWEYLASDK